MLDIIEAEAAFTSEVAAVRTERDVVEVAGPDACEYLHGQLSQDVEGLPEGQSTATLLLQPQGKIDGWLRLTRLGGDRYWLDVDPGFGQQALDRLLRFKLRVDAELSLVTLPMVAVRGPRVGRWPAHDRPDAPPGGAVLDALWPGVEGVDIIGEGAAIPPGMAEASASSLEALRIRLGIPMMGAELTTSTIPASAGIVDRSVDFTKGCYVGQELVARIDSRGSNTPTKLRAVRFAPDQPLPLAGAAIRAGGDVVGELTSVTEATSGDPFGLAYIKRAVEVPSAAEVVAEDGSSVAAELSALG
ncbi:MAG: YgfZ/GcvT domain-containing protein [Acidimicrobiales bacterium]